MLWQKKQNIFSNIFCASQEICFRETWSIPDEYGGKIVYSFYFYFFCQIDLVLGDVHFSQGPGSAVRLHGVRLPLLPRQRDGPGPEVWRQVRGPGHIHSIPGKHALIPTKKLYFLVYKIFTWKKANIFSQQYYFLRKNIRLKNNKHLSNTKQKI